MQMRALWQVGWANLRVVAICMLASAAMVALWHGVGLKSLAVGLVVVIGVGSVVFEAARIGTQSGLGWIAGALTPMLLNVLLIFAQEQGFV